jgi:hypothetical protein
MTNVPAYNRWCQVEHPNCTIGKIKSSSSSYRFKHWNPEECVPFLWCVLWQQVQSPRNKDYIHSIIQSKYYMLLLSIGIMIIIYSLLCLLLQHHTCVIFTLFALAVLGWHNAMPAWQNKGFGFKHWRQNLGKGHLTACINSAAQNPHNVCVISTHLHSQSHAKTHWLF